MESSTPFVLSVLRAHAAGTLSDDSTRAILRETLVLLVRRKMTELATTQYDVMFPSLLGKTYRVEQRAGLGDIWMLLSDNIAGTGSAIGVVDVEAADQNLKRFYRVTVMP